MTNWRGLGTARIRRMTMLGRSRPPRDGGSVSHLIRTALAGSVVLLLGLPVGAEDSNPAPAYFAGGLSAQSSWDEIRKKSGMQADFPFLGFGSAFVPLPAVCLEGETLRIADPQLDNGVRLAADRSRTEARASAAANLYAAARADRFSVGSATGSAAPAPPLPERPDQPEGAPTRYDVSVYRVIPTGFTPVRVLLFQKPWEIAACARP